MTWIWIAVPLLASVLAIADEATISITDQTDQNSPVRHVGFVTINTNIANGTNRSSHYYDLTARNISEKPILAIVEQLDISQPNGNKSREIRVEDMFFTDKIMNPGDVLALSSSDSTDDSEQITPIRRPTNPSAEIRTLYVQFEDGTTFGDEHHASRLVESRQRYWNAAAHINEVYATQGEKAYLSELQKRADDQSVDTFMTRFRRVQEEKGTAAAIAMIRAVLTRAERRQAAKGAHPIE